MSYCVGVKRKAGVLLLADSAVTAREPHPAQLSSFGEFQEGTVHGYVWEGVLKLIPLGPSAAGAYAGNVAIGVDLLRHVRHYLAQEFTPTQALQCAVSTIGPPAAQVKVLIAAWTSSGPLLLRYNADGLGRVVDETYGMVDFGSLSETMPLVVTNFSSVLSEHLGGISDSAFLSALLAVMQSYGVHAPLMQMHVGGAMLGLWVDAEGVHWMPDTSYVLYHPCEDFVSGKNLGWISIAARWGAVGIDSTVSGDKRFLLSKATTHDPEAWWARYQREFSEILGARLSRIFVFLSRQAQVATVVEVPDPSMDPRLRVSYPSAKEIALSIREGLLRDLRKTHPLAPSGEFDVILHYVGADAMSTLD